MIPRATYRLQFHKGFTFADAVRQVDYLAALGISHVYASPILTARAGSRHGYDVVDHSRINPELGGMEGLLGLVRALKARGLGLIVDIVPNHMAVGRADNLWWQDVLRKGRASPFAEAFDIDWDMLDGKLLAPFLDGQPQALWQKGALTLGCENGEWAFAYFSHRFALRPEDQDIAVPSSWAEAQALLARQHFVLADWREADTRLNWRRFFDITELAALRIAEPEVFEAVHRLTFDLYAQGLIDGVRVDHVDGLADPAAYCRLLRQRLAAIRPHPYVIVEKILARHEALPADWQTDGTTGYDAMNDVAALLHGDDGGVLEGLWRRVSGRGLSFEDEEVIARREILHSKFAGPFEQVLRAFAGLVPDATPEALRHDMEEVFVALRCYRGYATGFVNSPGPGPILSQALDRAPYLRPLFEDRSGDPQIADALRRFHQLSAPVAAKAVEDTAFYRYGRLLSRNDVGFDPRCAFLTPEEFHARVRRRARDYPHAMLTTATHDHKRGEDARARLAALTAHAQQWRDFVQAAPEPGAVDPADAYILYQTLLGSWPASPDRYYVERIEAWCRKHLREAKLRSSWQAPDEIYEDSFCAFARHLILKDAPFAGRLTALLGTITPDAQTNSLVQVVLRNTLPGVPDLYQGCEFRDLSLVDPDNRRPVDYAARAAALAAPLLPDAPFDRRKQKLIALLLAARRNDLDLWAYGDYQPLPAPDGIIAFQRRHGAQRFCVVARCNSREGDGLIPLPFEGINLLSSQPVSGNSIAASALLDNWPAALWLGAQP